MKVLVEHVYGPMISKLHLNGWWITLPVGWGSGCSIDLSNYRRICGVVMQKDFQSVGDAMREFERISGCDVIADQDPMGCAVNCFWWDDPNAVGGRSFASGWECGKHMYKIWHRTPRECLETLNREPK
jgi:hypothetical protein